MCLAGIWGKMAQKWKNGWEIRVSALCPCLAFSHVWRKSIFRLFLFFGPNGSAFIHWMPSPYPIQWKALLVTDFCLIAPPSPNSTLKKVYPKREPLRFKFGEIARLRWYLQELCGITHLESHSRTDCSSIAITWLAISELVGKCCHGNGGDLETDGNLERKQKGGFAKGRFWRMCPRLDFSESRDIWKS